MYVESRKMGLMNLLAGYARDADVENGLGGSRGRRGWDRHSEQHRHTHTAAQISSKWGLLRSEGAQLGALG